jgi:hypothetical protein
VIDCADPQSLARFWAAATGYELQSDEDDWASVIGEGEREIRIGFQKVPERKVVKNRVHVRPRVFGRGDRSDQDRSPWSDEALGLRGSGGPVRRARRPRGQRVLRGADPVLGATH